MMLMITVSVHRKALSEPPAGQSSTSGQHVVYETVCAKTGEETHTLSVMGRVCTDWHIQDCVSG